MILALLSWVSLSSCGFVGASGSSNTSQQPQSAGQLSASPSSINFGSVPLGGSGSTQVVTLTNMGSASLTISQATVTGAGFSTSGLTLPLTLAVGQSSSFSVGFAPAATGSVTGSVSLVSNAPSSPTTIALSGTGVQPQLSVTPTSVSFGSVVVGTTNTQTVTLTNSGSASLTISQATVTGAGFSLSGLTLPLTLAVGQSTNFNVAFAPAGAGSVTGSVSVVSNATNSPATITLSGSGVQAGLTVTPTSIAFGNVLVGATASQSVTLTNSGSASLTISQATVTGAGFSTSGLTLPLTLAVGQSSSFSVGFAPAATGSVTGSVSLVSNAPSSPTAIALSGTGVAATFQLTASPTSLSFGNVLVGTSSTQAVTLSNTGNSSVTISQISVSGAGFSASGLTLPLTLAASQTATLSVTFAPTAAGSVTGSVSVVSNATNSPATITLSGSGIQPALTVSPTSLAFGNVLVGSSSTQTVTLTNSGSASLTVSQAPITGSGFSLNGLVVPLTLAAGQSALFTVTFAPSTTGSVTGSVSLVSSAPNSPTTIALSGTGVQPQLSVTPTSVSFGSVVVGTTNTQTVTLTNSGTASLTISQATITGAGFSLSGLTLPLTLAAAQRANFNVAFAPAATGTVTGSVSLVSNAPGSPTTIDLSGTGVAATFQLTASPTSLSFGNVLVGTSSTQAVTLSNTGNSNVTVSQISVSGVGFSMSGLVPPVILSAGQSTSFSVVFAPTVAGSVTGSVSVVSNATNSPATTTLSGSGVQPAVTITTTNLPNGTVGVSYTATLSATGGTTPYFWSISGSGQLPPGLTLSTTGTISGTPTTAGTFTFQVQVQDSAGLTSSSSFSINISSTSSCGGPQTYCSRTDLATVQLPSPIPNVGNLTGANTIVTDPDFGNRIVRVTDANTNPSTPNQTMVAGEGGSADVNEWNTNSTLFYTGSTTAIHYLWTFNPSTMQASRMYVSSFPSTGGMTFASSSGNEWSRVNQNVLYLGAGVQIQKLDFTDRVNPPAAQLVFDYSSSANCLSSGFSPTWQVGTSIAAGDAAFADGFSNNGGQGGPGAVYVVAYKPGLGCRVLRTDTGQITGDWGPTGAATTTCRILIHNAKISKDGNWVVVAPQTDISGCPGFPGNLLFWNVGSLTVGVCGTDSIDTNLCAGHWTEGYTHWINSDGVTGEEITRPFSSLTSRTTLTTSYPPGLTAPFDLHQSWNNVDVNDSVPFFLTTVLNTIPFPSAWYREILGVASNGSGTVWRFAHTFNSGQSARFATAQAIGTVSQDGKFFIFSSDWMGTLGSESGSSSCTLGTDCRGDVFIVELR